MRPDKQIRGILGIRQELQQDGSKNSWASLKRSLLTIAVGLAVLFLTPYILKYAFHGVNLAPPINNTAHAEQTPSVEYRIDYSPSTNLEHQDVQTIKAAQHNIDAAIYSLTDYVVCDALLDAISRGVHVRVYRDYEQFEQEQAHARGRGSCSQQLANSGAEVRVKAPSVLMHLKSYDVDGSILRTGSANISDSGEKQQDNDLLILRSTVAAQNYEKLFEYLWNRPDNQTLKAGN
jgi:phosphatidylserine/phosphatidylglycerophosphate/cardiolipin synthase-like enzyme